MKSLHTESFKVLVKELQALALNVAVYDHENNEIELSKIGEDDEPTNFNADDVGRSVLTDDYSDSYTEVDENGDEVFENDEDEEDDPIGLDENE